MALTDPFGLPGHLLDGQFRVDRFVGEGGSSAVYQGFHLGLNEPIAIKCLKLSPSTDAAANDAFVKRFREESRVLYRLSQGTPNIVRSIAGGTTGAPASGALLPYMVLEWLEGRSLASDFDQRASQAQKGRSLDDAVRLLDAAAEGLGYANQQGVVHGDVNPRNVFITTSGGGARTKVLDFGVARIMSDSNPSDTRQFAPAYGAPEQFDTSLGPVGTWTDVYAFALVALEALLGRSARAGVERSDFARAALDASANMSPIKRGVAVSAEVDAIFRRAFAMRPNDRWADVGEFWSALKHAMSISQEVARLPKQEQTSHTLRPAVSAPPQKGPVLSVRTPAGILSPKRPLIRQRDPLISSKDDEGSGNSIPPIHVGNAPFSAEATLVDAKIPSVDAAREEIAQRLGPQTVQLSNRPAEPFDEDGPTLMQSPKLMEAIPHTEPLPASSGTKVMEGAPKRLLPPLAPPPKVTGPGPVHGDISPAAVSVAVPIPPPKAPAPPPPMAKTLASQGVSPALPPPKPKGAISLDPVTFVAGLPDVSSFKGEAPAIAEKPEAPVMHADESEFSRSVPLGTKVLDRLSKAAPPPAHSVPSVIPTTADKTNATAAAIGGVALGLTLLIGYVVLLRDKAPPPPAPPPITVIAVSPPPPEPIVIPAAAPDAGRP